MCLRGIIRLRNTLQRNQFWAYSRKQCIFQGHGLQKRWLDQEGLDLAGERAARVAAEEDWGGGGVDGGVDVGSRGELRHGIA